MKGLLIFCGIIAVVVANPVPDGMPPSNPRDGGAMMASMLRNQMSKDSFSPFGGGGGGDQVVSAASDESPSFVVEQDQPQTAYIADGGSDSMESRRRRPPGVSAWKHRADFERNDRQHDIMKLQQDDQNRRQTIQEMKMDNMKDNMMFRQASYPPPGYPYSPYQNPDKKTSVLDKVISMRK